MPTKMRASRARVRLANAALQFGADVLKLRTPDSILVGLQNVSQLVAINVLGAWNLPSYFKGQVADLTIDRNLFFHPDTPKDYWPDYQAQQTASGYSALALKARRSSTPFTITEAEMDAEAKGNWVFDHCRKFGFRDGLYCVYANWAVVYCSGKLVVLNPIERAFLAVTAQMAIGQLEKIRPSREPPRLDYHLTPREIAVLQHRALNSTNEAIGARLKISAETVEVHLKHIRKKMRVDDTAIALLEAYKHGLIIF